ncbi:MAG: hypothetical protein WCP39_01855 [Chlamydiota bacterium]
MEKVSCDSLEKRRIKNETALLRKMLSDMNETIRFESLQSKIADIARQNIAMQNIAMQNIFQNTYQLA